MRRGWCWEKAWAKDFVVPGFKRLRRMMMVVFNLSR